MSRAAVPSASPKKFMWFVLIADHLPVGSRLSKSMVVACLQSAAARGADCRDSPERGLLHALELAAEFQRINNAVMPECARAGHVEAGAQQRHDFESKPLIQRGEH